ncbi:b(0,+)-type amino acid transporter 1-like isoform X3 [Lates japonicus]|uniref:B(0,+)-type amino acid transporter 1-like isoform X3 n=1 Tax=Lates japonicus TaxID=270547 RepID=A0AAD3R5L4_LATJO|nr:b(0,+)-type amino acid transporter 1-like isoform X3 [Lates japonicus]
MESDKQRLNLKREVGIIGAMSFIAGTMIGSGIFISPQYVLASIGSPGASLIIWACCGLIAMVGGLCYAELGTVIPESGAEYIYMLRTSGKVVAFMFVFSFIIVMRPASATGIALGFAEYVVAPFYDGCTPPQLVVKCMQEGNTQNFDNFFEGTNVGVSSIGCYPPQLLVKCAATVAILVVAIVNILNVRLLSESKWLWNKVLGSWGWIMSVAAALSAFGSLNGTFFSGGRGVLRRCQGRTHDILAMAHVHRLTPSPALIFTTIISLVVLIPGDFQSIVNFFSFTAWFFYAITLSGLIYLKIKKPELPRPYRVPIILPILVLIAAIFLVLAPIIDKPQIEYLYVTLFIFSGVIIYIPFIHYKLCPGLLTKLTVFLQLFLEVALAEKNL